MLPSQLRSLRELARLYGVYTEYRDVFSRRITASAEVMCAILRGLGCPIRRLSGVSDALRERRQELWRRGCELVVVAWEGKPTSLQIRLPAHLAGGAIRVTMRSETGKSKVWVSAAAKSPEAQEARIEGIWYVTRRLAMPRRLPFGYHSIRLDIGSRSFKTLVISAPCRAYSFGRSQTDKTWGIGIPLYALSSRRDWGHGNYSNLKELVRWVGRMGGGIVGTLPLLPSFWNRGFDPSPYVPSSRLFWNEFYVDATTIPELAYCPRARAVINSLGFKRKIAALRSSRLVDYMAAMGLQRKVLQEMKESLFAGHMPKRLRAFRNYVQGHPMVEDYARFQAASEKRAEPWTRWPLRLRSGFLTTQDYAEEARDYYLYAQWIAHEQIGEVTDYARRYGAGLYLDLPIGASLNGYDVWREREAFALDARGGAPPDTVFTAGQQWPFPPLHPERIREQGYRYYIACLRHHLAHARLLRIDHVMALHRLFWIPRGMDASHGAYVRYRSEEMYAILCLESHRSKTVIVGENLGTVPPEVNAAMSRHKIQRLFVMEYELPAQPIRVLSRIPRDSVSSLNTHDMPTFASFWKGLDIPERVKLGLLSEPAGERERRKRQAMRKTLAKVLERDGWLALSKRTSQVQSRPKGDVPERPCDRRSTESSRMTGFLARHSSRRREISIAELERCALCVNEVLRACLAFLSASPSVAVLVNLEDLWLEEEPQNVPSTYRARANWRRKARYTLEDFVRLPGVIEVLRCVSRLRGKGGMRQ